MENKMNYKYVDRSRIVYDELVDEEMCISTKAQTGWAIDLVKCQKSSNLLSSIKHLQKKF